MSGPADAVHALVGGVPGCGAREGAAVGLSSPVAVTCPACRAVIDPAPVGGTGNDDVIAYLDGEPYMTRGEMLRNAVRIEPVVGYPAGPINVDSADGLRYVAKAVIATPGLFAGAALVGFAEMARDCANALDAANGKLAEIEAAVAPAPHAPTCAAVYERTYDCDCWKADVRAVLRRQA